LKGANIPFVTLGRSEASADHAWIDLDFEATATIALERLIGQGHQRIAVTIPNGDVNFGYVFLATYKRILAKHGLPFDPGLVVTTRRTEQAGYEALGDLLALMNPPTAVLLIFEVTAIGLYRRMLERGMEPGRDLAIVAFRDEPTTRFLMPSLTCFSLSLAELGESVGTALLAQIPRFQRDFPQGRIQHLHELRLKEGDSDRYPPRLGLEWSRIG
jgi:DNA-binding LacI/PurR family transcriptional regulator